jgi:hypothetical protein
MKFEETRNIITVVNVNNSKFSDTKEIAELFTYVFERSELYKSIHPRNTFNIEYDNGGYRVCKFILTLDADDEDFYAQRVADLKSLMDDYEAIEKEYLRFKVFGNIESGALIRRKS